MNAKARTAGDALRHLDRADATASPEGRPSSRPSRGSRQPLRPAQRFRRHELLALAVILLVLPLPVPHHAPAPLALTTANAQATKPYDTKLLRLSEILGAVHYLRELCGADDGQIWREQMQRLIKAEGFTALRKARLARSFNKGYQSYSRTYKICTSTARTAIERFLDEGTEIAEELIRSNP